MKKITLITICALCLISTKYDSQTELKDGMLLKKQSSDNIYLIIDSKKCLITDLLILKNLFVNLNSIVTVSNLTFETLPFGNPIKEAYLCKGTEAPIFLVINKIKRHVSSVAVFNAFNFNWGAIKVMKDEELIKIKTGNPIVLYNYNLNIYEEPLPCGNKD